MKRASLILSSLLMLFAGGVSANIVYECVRDGEPLGKDYQRLGSDCLFSYEGDQTGELVKKWVKHVLTIDYDNWTKSDSFKEERIANDECRNLDSRLVFTGKTTSMVIYQDIKKLSDTSNFVSFELLHPPSDNPGPSYFTIDKRNMTAIRKESYLNSPLNYNCKLISKTGISSDWNPFKQND